MALDPQIRTLIRTRTRTRRRSVCHRHPNEPVTGLCALCLRDRLADLDSYPVQHELEHENIVAFSSSRRTRGHGGASSSGVVPELRRSKSVAVEKCEVLNGLSLDLRRKSCDVRTSNTLSDLFDIDDTKRGGDGIVRVESKNLGFSSIAEPMLKINEDKDDCSGIRISDDLFVRNELDDDGEIGEEEDLRTMKEHIDMELQNKKRNFWEAASVFNQKLRKWRQKHKEKKRSGVCNGRTDNNRSTFGQFKDPQSEVADYGLGRRSCDTEPRFSIDFNRMSVEDPRFSYDEHRASWDGYMIARTIPRLTPMLPIVDNMMLPPVNKNGIAMDSRQVHLLKEDGASSSASARSNSESSSSNTGSTSSSMKSSVSKTAGLEGDDMKSVSKVRVSQANDVIGRGTKLVITERELKDWHLSSINDSNVESASNAPISTCTAVMMLNGHKKKMTSRWGKVSNLWSYKYKLGDKKQGDYIRENGASVNRNNEIDGVEQGNSSANLVRNSCSVGSRNKTESHPSGEEGSKKSRAEFLLDRNRSTRYSMSDLDSDLLRLYLSPFRKSKF